ncbi:MAG: selenocysteine-specific translation elongation factor, partial [Blautia sp.]|nr:selenocysteine-specific translation elongation factor [Blautia sp.]
IDHGKTLLTKALTGVDTDRLAEEKARGITIELGFARMNLDPETSVSIVDVPGHEKFVKTMMAGASGIDAALLLIAADDGIMPQTREHLDILRLLRVSRGILVITKCDLVEECRISEVRSQIQELVRGSFLENARIVCVSAHTGAGIPELKEAMRALLPEIRRRSTDLPFRLPVDRVFQIEGFGTIAAGTLTEGQVSAGDPVSLFPADLSGSLRAIQNHGEEIPTAQAGMRTAVRLSSNLREHVSRGCFLAEPDSMLTSCCLDVFLEITENCPYTIRNSSNLHFFHGTKEITCKLRLLAADALTAGQSGYAQLLTDSPVSSRNGDRFLLRFFSPVLTVGGGVILNGSSRRGKRNHAPFLRRLELFNSDDWREGLLQRFEDAGLSPLDGTTLRKICNLGKEPFIRAVEEWTAQEILVELLPGAFCTRNALLRKNEQVQELLCEYHKKYPLQPGMPAAELKQRLFTKDSAAALSRMIAEGSVISEGQYLHLPGFAPVFTQEHKIMQRKLLHYYKDAGFLAPDRTETDRKFAHRQPYYSQVLANMLLNRQLLPLSPVHIVHPECEAAAREIFFRLFETRETVTLADFRDAAQISRKYAQLFLEYWDHQGYCRRIGNSRILISSFRSP